MMRTALIAGVSVATLVCAGPTTASAAWNSESWWGTTNKVVEPEAVQKPARSRSRPVEKTSASTDKTPVPTGVLHIIVSIDKQRATLFADGAPFAGTAISSGTPGHPTPTGVFTVIQKDRHHVSNLYNASMPYMQRITWSGSALHQGPLPGYPASHGCVRLTDNFAQLLWKATKMGARVIVTRPDVAPLEFEHARLFVPKPKVVEAPPLPVASPLKLAELPRAVAPVAVAQPAASTQPTVSAQMASERATMIGLIKTADAANAVAVMAVVGDGSKAVATSVVTEPAANAPAAEQPTKQSITDGVGGKPEPAPLDTAPVAETQPAEAKPTESGPAEVKAAEAAPVTVTPVEAKPVEGKPVEKPDAPISIIVDERPKVMAPAIVQEANGRPISVFASLKEGKLYVRQGWKALFDAPIGFERPEQPIGTHVYTAMGHKIDGSGLRWTVVTIPSSTRRVAELKSSDGRKRHHEPIKAVEAETSLPSAGAALDRIVIPPELAARISELITPGSSLIVSDNKLSDETGEYTDFIVLTR